MATKLKPVQNYLKNVMRSTKMAASEIGRELAPDIASMYDSNKEYIKQTVGNLKLPKMDSRRKINAIMNSKIFQSLDNGFNNAMNDIKTGNFYNTERENQVAMEAADISFGDWDDLSEFGIDPNWEENLNTAKNDKTVTAGDMKIVKSVEQTSAASAQATIKAIMISGNNNTRAARANTALISEQMDRIYGGIHKDLSVIGATMTSIFKLQSTVLINMDKNSSTYYTESLKLQNQQIAMMKEMLEMQRNQYKSAMERELESASKKSSKRKRFSTIASFSGLADIDKYIENVRDNIKEELSIMNTFSVDDASDMLSMMMASPLKGITHFIVEKVIPQNSKNIIKDLNDTAAGIFGNLITKMSKNKNAGGISGILARVFGVDTSVNRKLDTGKYEKGAIPFDGISRRAITQVIPAYLARIEAYLTGGDMQLYDYNQGKFKSSSKVSAEFGEIKKRAAFNATYDLANAMSREVRKNAPTNDAEGYALAFDEFRQYLYDVNGQFRPRENKNVNGVDRGLYPHFYKYYDRIVRAYRDFEYVDKVDNHGNATGMRIKTYGKKMAVSAKALREKDAENNLYRTMEAGGTSAAAMAAQYSGNIKGKGAVKNILEVKDKYGHSIYSYLHNINAELTYWRVNGGPMGGGSSSGGGSKRVSIGAISAGLKTREQKQQEKEERRNNAKKASHASNYRKDALKLIARGGFQDLTDFDLEQAEYLFDLNATNPKERERLIKEQIGDDYDRKRFLKFFNDQYTKANIRSLEDVQTAINRAKLSGKKTNEVMTEAEAGTLKKLLNKLGGVGNRLQQILYAPAEVFNSVLLTADRAVYQMFFKDELDINGNHYNGFLDMLAGETSSKLRKAFSKLEEFINNRFGNVRDFRDRFTGQIRNTVSRFGNAFGGSARDLYRSAANVVRYGVDGENIESLQDKRFKGMNASDRKAYRDSMYAAGVKGGSVLNERVAKQGFYGDLERKKKILIGMGVDEARINNIIQHAADPDEALNKVFNRLDVKKHSRGTRSGRPYVGNTMLSQGEMLFNEDGISVVNKTGAYSVNKPTHILNSQDSYGILSSFGVKGLKRKSRQRDAALEEIEARKMMSKHAYGTFESSKIFNANFNKKNGLNALGDLKNFLPEGAAGAVLGGGVSLALGLMGGPLVGAAIGAGATLVSKSEKVQKFLFGELDENGGRKNNGLIKQSVQDMAKKYFPDVSKGALGGLALSMLTPLGPVAGLMLGGAFGFLKQNDEMRERLFGKLKIGEDEKRIIKKMLPGALKGAGAGVIATLFGGPFGLMGNAVVGSALGMMASTDEFKEGLLGKTINGVKVGGVLGVVRDAFQPLKDAAISFKDRILASIEENILNPLADFVQPTIHAIPQLIAWLPRKLNDIMTDKFGWGMDTVVQKILLAPLKKLAKPIEMLGAGFFRGATAPVRLLGAVGNKIRATQMATGNAAYMTAEQRLQFANSHFRGRRKNAYDRDNRFGDEFLAGLSADDAQNMLNQLSSIDDSISVLSDERRKQNKALVNRISSWRSAEGYRISVAAKNEIKAAINQDRLDDIPNILMNFPLEGSDRGMTREQVQAFMNGKNDKGTNVAGDIARFKALSNRIKSVRNMTDADRKNSLASVKKLLGDEGVSQFDINSKSGRQKLMSYLQTEVNAKKSSDYAPGTTLEAQRQLIESQNLERVNNINETLQKIADNGIKISGLGEDYIRDSLELEEKFSSGMSKMNRKADLNTVLNSNAMGLDVNAYNSLSDEAKDMLTSQGMSRLYMHAPGPGFIKRKFVNAGRTVARSVENLEGIDPKYINALGGNLSTRSIERVKKITTLKKANGLSGDIPVNIDALQFALSISDGRFAHIHSIFKNEAVRIFFSHRKQNSISIEDMREAEAIFPFRPELYKTLKRINRENQWNKFNTLNDVMTATGTSIAANSIEASNQPPQDRHFIGTLLGGLVKGALGIGKGLLGGISSLFGGNKDNQGSSEQDSKQNTAISALSSIMATGAGKTPSAAAGAAIGGDVDQENDNTSIVQTSEGPAQVTRKTDGSIEYNTADNKTKEVVNKITMKEKLQEKLMNAQIKASEAVHSALEVGGKVKTKAKKGLGWLAALLIGGALLKSGILGKLWNNVLVPLWEKHIWPWMKGTAFPWIKEHILTPAYEHILKPAGKWLLNTALPAVGNLLVNTVVPAASKAIGGIIGALFKNLPALLKGGANTVGTILDAITGNSTNAGGVTTVDATGKSGATGMYDENGNVLTYEQIASGNFGKIFNADGVEGKVNEDGTVSFADTSIAGSSFAMHAGNVGIHALANHKIAGAVVKGVSKTSSILSKFGGIAGKLAGKGLDALSAPAKWGSNLAKKITTPSAAKVAAEAASAAGDASKKAGFISKIFEGINKAVNFLFKDNKVLSKITNSAIGMGVKNVANWINGLKDKVIGVFTGAIEKFSKTLSSDTLKKMAGKALNVLNYVLLAVDFVSGMDAAESKLEVSDTSFMEELASGFVNAIGNLVLLSIIPGAINWCAQKLVELFGGDLSQRQAEAEAEYQQWVDSTGSTMTKQEYLEYNKSVTGKVKHGVVNGVKAVGSAIKNAGSAAIGGVKKAGSAIGGFFSGLFGPKTVSAATLEDTPANQADKLMATDGDTGTSLVSKITSGIGSFASGAVDLIKNGLSNTANNISSVLSSLANIKTKETDEIVKKAKDGRVSVFSAEYWQTGLNSTGGLGGIIQSIYNGMIRVVNAPSLIIGSLLNQLASFFTAPLSAISGLFGNSTKATANYINQDGVNLATGSHASSSIGAATSVMSTTGATKTASVSTGTRTNASGNMVSVKPVTTKSNTTASSSSSSSSSGNIFTRAWSGIKSLFGFGKGTGRYYGSGLYGGYSKQIDPSIAGIRFNNGSDSEIQTIGDSGCGPAAAVNVMESLYGRGSQDIVNAAQFAASHGYKETDGGTRPEFFTDYFSRNGYASDLSYNKKRIENNIRAGRPTVLMGKDARGTSNSTPFGKVPHYVTVTGMDSKGRAIVQDPESRHSNQLYSMRDIMNKTQLGVSAMGKYGRGGLKFNRYGRGISKLMFIGDSRTVMMYNALFGNAGDSLDNDGGDGNHYVAKVGAGYIWLTDTGWSKVRGKGDSNTALVIWLGINDIYGGDQWAKKYASYVNAHLDEALKTYGEVYVVSVGPVGANGLVEGQYSCTNNDVASFNNTLKSELDSRVKYIDIFSAMVNDPGTGPDNLHYTDTTSKVIYEMIVNAIGVSGAATTNGTTTSVNGVTTTNGGTTDSSTNTTTNTTTTTTPTDSRNMLLVNVHYAKNRGLNLNSSSDSSSDEGTSSSSSSTSSTSSSSSATVSNGANSYSGSNYYNTNGPVTTTNAVTVRRAAATQGTTATRTSATDANSAKQEQLAMRKVAQATNVINTQVHNTAATNANSAKQEQLMSQAKNKKSTAATISSTAKFTPTPQKKENIFTRAVNFVTGLFTGGKGKYGRGRYGRAGEDGLQSVGQFLSNTIANSAAAQVLNSFLDFGSAPSSSGGTADQSTTSNGTVSNGSDLSSSSSGSTSVGFSGSGDFPTYNLSDRQLLGVSNIVENEQGDVAGWAAEASQIANLTDIDGGAHTADDIEAKLKSGWYADGASRFDNPGSPSQQVMDIVRKVIMEGKRTLPRYIDEHDYIGDIASISTGDKNTRSDYVPHQTIVQQDESVGGGRWTFYGFPSGISDAFGYTSEANRQKYGENHYDVSGLGRNGIKPISKFGTGHTVPKYNRNKFSPRRGLGKYGLGKYGLGRRYGRGNKASEVWNWFTSHGYSEVATAALLGNMEQESGVDNECIQGNGAGPAAGIVQWENYNTQSSRWLEMAKYAESKGRDWKDLESQLEFVDKEMQGPDVFWSNASVYNSYDAFKQATDLNNATQDFEKAFERAGTPMMENRLKYAQDYYNKFKGTSGTAITGATTSSGDTTTGGGNTTNGGGQQSSVNGQDGLSSIGQWLSNVIANSPAAQVLNSFLDFGGGGGGGQQQQSANNSSSSSSTAGDISGLLGGTASGTTASGAAADVVRIAQQEAATAESERASGTYNNTTENNGDNNVKYNTWYYGNKVSGDEYPWCAAFVSWVTNQAGVPESIFPKDAYTVTAYQSVQSKGGSYPSNSEGAPGDIAYFTNNASPSGIYHTGIVENVSGGQVNTIEGNSSDSVYRRSYDVGNSNVLLARPNYASVSSTSTIDTGNVASSGTSDVPDVSSTLGGNGIKPISKYGAFREGIYGRGSGTTKLGSTHVKLKTKDGYQIVERSGWDRKAGNALKNASRSTVRFGRGIGDVSYGGDYTGILREIINLLVSVANNTDKLNMIVSILKDKLNIEINPNDISNATNGNTNSARLASMLNHNANATNKLSTYADTVGDSSLQSVITAINAIASE